MDAARAVDVAGVVELIARGAGCVTRGAARVGAPPESLAGAGHESFSCADGPP